MAGQRDNRSTMTPKAAEAFDLYVSLGFGRSLRQVAQMLVKQDVYKSSSAAMRSLAAWSVQFNWQDRLSAAITAQTENLLAKAAELDAKSFLKTSELVAKRLDWTTDQHIDAILKMRESVRRPVAKGAAHVEVNINIRQVAEEIAAEFGRPVEDVIAEAEAILRGAGKT